MKRIEGGESMVAAYTKHPEYRARLLRDYVSILAGIHGLDWQSLDLSFLGVPENDRQFGEKEIARWEQMVEASQYRPYPIMTELFSWLKKNIPPAECAKLCHGDYTMLNAYALDGRMIAIFDWEMASIGDPISDIGWAFMLGENVAGWDGDAVIRNYEEMTGKKVNEESLFFWRVYSFLKISAISVSGLKAGIEARDIYMLPVVLSMSIPTTLNKAARMLGF
jgi:aminoglycoside phosphotransferase (APT) family kinase protein